MRESEKKMQIVICLRTKHLGFLKNSLKRVRGSRPAPQRVLSPLRRHRHLAIILS